jgi:hypothetical protein
VKARNISRVRIITIWTALAVAIGVPIILTARSPLLAWRDPIYIAAGFAGVIAMVALFVQPVLAGGYMPGLPKPRARRLHRIIGPIVVGAVVLHVAGLWITSPPDVIDVLLFASPTPFSVWGAVAMWAIFATALLAIVRRRLGLRAWRRMHAALAIVMVSGSVIHALLIEGAMETVSKTALCVLVVAATFKALIDLGLLTWRRP